MSTVLHHYKRCRPVGLSSGGLLATRTLRAPVVLMVSGGADSTALLLKAVTSKLNLDDGQGTARIARERLHVLHINHHLRGKASDEDEEFVRNLAQQYGLPCCVEHAYFDDIGGQNLEAAARDVRYKAARRYVEKLSLEYGTPKSAARICTAHNATDRAETFLMNAIKGAGVSGLSSIPRRRNIVVRPLLDYTHEELKDFLRTQHQAWREDVSNQDTTYLRNYIRHRILPLARQKNSEFEHVMNQTCDILGDEDAFMQHLAATALRTLIQREDEGLLILDAQRLAASEIAMARRIVRLALCKIYPEIRLSMSHITAVLDLVAVGRGSLTLPGNIDARVEFGSLAFRNVKFIEENTSGWLGIPGTLPVTKNYVISSRIIRLSPQVDALSYIRSNYKKAREQHRENFTTYIDFATLGFLDIDQYVQHIPDKVFDLCDARLWVDTASAGDIFCPLGMCGRTKKLSDLFGECKIPVRERSQIPIIRTVPGGSVVWVAGIRLDERFKCVPTSKVLVELSIHRID